MAKKNLGTYTIAGYKGKIISENNHEGERRIEFSTDLLKDVVAYKRDVLKENDFNVKSIRGFKAKEDSFSLVTGIGYDPIESDLLGFKEKKWGLHSQLFEAFVDYRKEPTKEQLDFLNKKIETFNKSYDLGVEKFEGYNKEYEKEINLKKEEKELKELDNKMELAFTEFKKNMLENLDDDYLVEYLADTEKKYLRSDIDAQINEFLESEDYKEHLEREIEYAIEDNGFSTEKMVKKYNLKDKLPAFKVVLEEGMAYASDGGGYQYEDSRGNFIDPDAQEKLEEIVVDLKGQEYWDNMDMSNIKDWEEINNTGFLTVIYDSTDKYGRYETKEYTDYSDYAKPTVDEKLKEVFLEKSKEFIEDVKKIVEKEDYIKEKKFEKLENKYQEKIDKLEKEINGEENSYDDFEEEKNDNKELEVE